MTTPHASQSEPQSASQSEPESASDSGKQVSEVASFGDPGLPISPGDSVSGAPTAESGEVNEGPTGPDAPTYSSQQDRHPDKDDVETTG
jgi:hypothetical protein